MKSFFRRPLWQWGIIIVALVVALGVAGTIFAQSQNGGAKTVQSAQVTRGAIESDVVSSAALQSAADLSLTFGTGGTITDIKVKPGDTVKAGQVIASLDTSDLNLAVVQAQANLSSSQAKLQQTQAGSAEKDVANGQAAVKSAQAKLDSLKIGPTATDLASAQAAVKSAQAKLDALKLGPTAQDLANAQAALTSAKAKYDALHAGPSPQDLANAQATLKSAQAKLDQLKVGPTSSDLAAANANLQSAQAKLDALKAPPTDAQLSAARLKVVSAQTSLTKAQSSLSIQKQNAEIALSEAANAVRDAQDKLRAASTIRGNESIVNPDGSYNSDATQTQIDAYNSALRAEQDAESNMHKAQLALDDARLQETQGLASAQASLDDANKQLADLTAPPTQADLAAAQAAVVQAQNSLDKLKAPPTQADLVAAQAAIDQAQNNLDKLNAPPTRTDLEQAQAAIDQAQNNLDKLKLPATAADRAAAEAGLASAQASLAKLKAPATQADVVAAQAAVDQAVNNLNDLKAGPKATDLAIAQAAVDQAAANLESARSKLKSATLVAPFSGEIAEVPVVVGQTVTASTAVADLVDNSSFHIDMNVGEADINNVKVGQPVDITLDALPGVVYTGTVTFVQPKATVQQGVVTYLTTVTLDPKAAGNTDLRPGLTATAAAIIDQRADALLVPNRAIRTEGRQKVVYIAGPNGSQIRVPVQTGISDSTSTEITGDTPLREGDSLVISSSTTTSANRAPTGGGLINLGGGRAPGR